MIETNRIEFKLKYTEELDIEKEVISFLNYREGGIIYIGIDDNGHPKGVEDIDSVVLKIKDRIRTNVSPSPMGLFDVLIEKVDGPLLSLHRKHSRGVTGIRRGHPALAGILH